jgi:FkbM family methyltransferase
MNPNRIKSLFKTILPSSLLIYLKETKASLMHEYWVKSYSQEGEDMILRRILADKKIGFFVDIGAHHPIHLSNTYYFYEHGWSGINIDAMPGSMILFMRKRTRDINIEAALAKVRCERTYFIFNSPAVNSLDEKLSHEREVGDTRILAKHTIVTQTLEDILIRYLPPDTQIDFLSVDVEGLDLEVLESNNWKRYRPRYILAECYDLHLANMSSNALVSYLDHQGYDIFAKSYSTAFFVDRSHENA